MFCNSTITDLFLFVFTQLILHYQEGLLYKGNKEAIQAEVHRLIKEAGDEGIIIGADCTIPSDIDPQRILWVKEAVAE